MAEYLKAIAREWADTARLIAGILAIVLASKGLLLPYLISLRLPPAAILHYATIKSAAPGEETEIFILVEKLRNCVLQRASVLIIDSSGSIMPASHNIVSRGIGIAPKILLKYKIKIPAETRIGQASGRLEATYGNCSDGANPQNPVKTEISPFLVTMP